MSRFSRTGGLVAMVFTGADIAIFGCSRGGLGEEETAPGVVDFSREGRARTDANDGAAIPR